MTLGKKYLETWGKKKEITDSPPSPTMVFTLSERNIINRVTVIFCLQIPYLLVKQQNFKQNFKLSNWKHLQRTK